MSSPKIDANDGPACQIIAGGKISWVAARNSRGFVLLHTLYFKRDFYEDADISSHDSSQDSSWDFSNFFCKQKENK